MDGAAMLRGYLKPGAKDTVFLCIRIDWCPSTEGIASIPEHRCWSVVKQKFTAWMHNQTTTTLVMMLREPELQKELQDVPNQGPVWFSIARISKENPNILLHFHR